MRKNKRGLFFNNQTQKIKVLVLITLFFINISYGQSTGEYVEEEDTILEGHSRNFDTPSIHENGILFINFTNLQSSASRVNITRDQQSDKVLTWSPYVPLNFTLAPGETYSVTTKLVVCNQSQVGGYFIFGCHALTEDSSATIRFGYQVINEGTSPIPNIGFIASFLIIAVIATVVRILPKRLKKKKM